MYLQTFSVVPQRGGPPRFAVTEEQQSWKRKVVIYPHIVGKPIRNIDGKASKLGERPLVSRRTVLATSSIPRPAAVLVYVLLVDHPAFTTNPSNLAWKLVVPARRAVKFCDPNSISSRIRVVFEGSRRISVCAEIIIELEGKAHFASFSAAVEKGVDFASRDSLLADDHGLYQILLHPWH